MIFYKSYHNLAYTILQVEFPIIELALPSLSNKIISKIASITILLKTLTH